MRIVLFSAFYYPYRGGYVESVYEVSHGLARRGWDVTILACNTNHAARDENHEGVRIVRMSCWNPAWLNNSFPLPKPWAFVSVAWHLRRASFDVVITETRFFATTFLGILFSFFRKIPLMHVEQGSCHPASKSLIIGRIGALIDHIFGFLIAKHAAVIVGVSAEAASFMRHLGARNPSVIHNPVDTLFWQPRTSLRAKDRSTRILFVGRLVYAKGVQDLLRAVALLRASLQPEEFAMVRLIVVGDGPYKKSLISLAESLLLSETVSFLGEKDRVVIRNELWDASLFINPSYSEGLPVCVLEAAALAVPIIATDVGGTREIIPNGCGLLVAPRSPDALADGILRAMRDPNEFHQFGSAARNNVARHFSTPFIVDAYDCALRSIARHA